MTAARQPWSVGIATICRIVTVDDPWGFGNSLEWVTTCPPPRHNFTELPRIRSERPALDLHHPELGLRSTPTQPVAKIFGPADQKDR